jgi:hypothetical protein
MENKDWVGNKNSIFKTLGASNHTDKEREMDDFYATQPEAAEMLLELVELNKNIWECSCGQGHLSEVFKNAGHNVKSTDLVDRGYGESGIDFLTQTEIFDGDIISNPPYKWAKEFVEKGLELVNDGNKVIMFLKLQFMEGKARKKLFIKYPPKIIYVSSSRITCAKNADFDGMKAGGGSAVAYAWYVWEKNFNGETIVKWFN